MVHESPKKQRAEFLQNVSMIVYKTRNIILTIIFFLKKTCEERNFVSLLCQ